MNETLISYVERCPEDSNGQVQMDGDVVREILAALRAPAGVQAWVGLTDDEIEHLRNDQPWWVVRDIEAKLKEKNT